MRIGIFDSGIGGKAVANTLRKLMPSVDIISVNDSDHVPYGNRKTNDIINLTEKSVIPLMDIGCDAIIIACNTATAAAISTLRLKYPNVNFIGIEPMIKPAASITKTNRIAVCATPSTLQSKKYKDLVKLWAPNIEIIQPDCSDWAELIENRRSNEIDVDSVVSSLKKHDVDVVVLGCTHYHWIKQRIINAAGPNITVLEPSDAIAERTKSLIIKVD